MGRMRKRFAAGNVLLHGPLRAKHFQRHRQCCACTRHCKREKFVCSFQESCRMRCIYMSILLKSALGDVCECSRKPTERDAHSRYPIVRAAYAYPRKEAAWSVSACSMNQAVQEVHACSKNETARDTCVSSRNETDEWGPEMKPPKISACVPERNRQRYLDVCQNETARDIWVYEWNWRVYICMCSRTKPPEISECTN